MTISRASILALSALLISACGGDGASDPAPTPDATPDDAVSDAPAPDAATDAEADAVDSGHGDVPSEVTADALPPLCPPAATEVVSFVTDDGVTLEADLHTPGAAGTGAVVLLHMIPPGHDRTNYPVAFRELLVSQGFTVLSVDRRGAGGSGGNATEAYEGPNGKLDAAAAVAFLATLPCPPDPGRLALVGASNGTTTAVDYTVHVAADAEAELPTALVFLTGGSYTENQNKLSDHLDALGTLPILFVYAADEAVWSAGYLGTSDAWTHAEYAESGHGTNLFAAAPSSMDEVASWLAMRL
jgi:pimeloyl-ACP methyl ester carboxylesterase